MKRIIAGFLSLAAFAFAGYALAQNAGAETVIKGANVDVLVTYQQTPDFNVAGYTQKGSSTKNRWLQIEGSFITEKADGQPFLNEITVKYEVFMASAVNARGQAARALFAGEETYSLIARDGLPHKVVAFLAPAYINAYKGPAVKLKKAEDEFTVMITISTMGRPIAVGVMASKADQKDFKITRSSLKADVAKIIQAANADNNMVKMTGAVVRRGTPYEFINFDSYEFLKPAAAASASTAN